MRCGEDWEPQFGIAKKQEDHSNDFFIMRIVFPAFPKQGN